MANNQNQKQLIYAFVSRGTVILAEFTEFSGNFNSIAFQCLQKLPSTNNKFTYNCDNHTFNYLIDNGYSTCNFPFDLTFFFTHLVPFYVQLIASLVVFLHKLLNPIFFLIVGMQTLDHLITVWLSRIFNILAWIGGSL